MESYVIRVYRNEGNMLVAQIRRICDNEEFITHNLAELAAVLGIENDNQVTERKTDID